MANDSIVELNNYLQASGRLASLSWQDSTSGPIHAPQWTSVCKIFGEPFGTGTGTHKHHARNVAAAIALKALVTADGRV